jgi:DNA-binding transcriptional ArsR family regulator
LFGLLKDPERATRNCRVPELRNNFPDVHALLFHAATAFTNVRRLRVLRRLAATKTVTAESLSEELHMSSSAVSRHLIKLIRRGFAQTVPGRWPLAYELARQFKTPIHAEMLAIVRSSWTKKESRQ